MQMRPSCNNDVIPTLECCNRCMWSCYFKINRRNQDMNKLVENKQINQRSTLIRGV